MQKISVFLFYNFLLFNFNFFPVNDAKLMMPNFPKCGVKRTGQEVISLECSFPVLKTKAPEFLAEIEKLKKKYVEVKFPKKLEPIKMDNYEDYCLFVFYLYGKVDDVEKILNYLDKKFPDLPYDPD